MYDIKQIHTPWCAGVQLFVGVVTDCRIWKVWNHLKYISVLAYGSYCSYFIVFIDRCGSLYLISVPATPATPISNFRIYEWNIQDTSIQCTIPYKRQPYNTFGAVAWCREPEQYQTSWHQPILWDCSIAKRSHLPKIITSLMRSCMRRLHGPRCALGRYLNLESGSSQADFICGGKADVYSTV